VREREHQARRGWFVTVEGPDGAGKTLVTERLRSALEARGIEVLATREPGGTAVGERVRRILLDHLPDDPRLDPRTDALLFSAARAQLVAEVIRPALARGLLVLDARHADSTLAYQGYGGGLPLATLRELQAFATAGLRPDLTLLLDVPVEVGLARKQADEQTRFEAAFDVAFHRRVRDGYRELAAAEPDRFVVIDATGSVDDVVARGLAAILARIGPGTGPPSPPVRLSR
jgi:dTMP kinase